MKVLRNPSKYALLHHTRDQNVLKEVQGRPDLLQINNYNNKWVQRVSRMEISRLVRAVMKYQPTGKGN
jgi:hypothetical protein